MPSSIAFQREVAGLAVGPTWAQVRDRYPTDRVDDARREYSADPWVQIASRALWGKEPHRYWCLDQADPRTAFVANSVAGVGVPYAWLDEEGWEQMGYLEPLTGAAPPNPDPLDQWCADVAAKWASLDPGLWIANVDCHS